LADRSEGGIPFYRSKEIIEMHRGYSPADPDFISRDLYVSIKERFGVPKSGDLLVTSRGTIGIPYLYNKGDEFYFADGNLTWFKDFSKDLNSRFLYYWIESEHGRHNITTSAKGTAQKAVSIGFLQDLEVEFPNLEIQREIVKRLVAYDQLIENNRKQIKLLEEAAQRLYKEWFIDLRFSGHETTPIIDGLPKSWQSKPIGDCINLDIGGGWGVEAESQTHNVKALVIRATDIAAVEMGSFVAIPVRWHTVSNLASRRLDAGDIIFEVSGGSKEYGVGRSLLISSELLSKNDAPFICASFCKRIKPSDGLLSTIISQSLRFALQNDGLRKYEKRSAGNIINFLWSDFLNNYQVRIPPTHLLNQFVDKVNHYDACRANRALAISLAAEARNRLLPKLMDPESELL